MLEFSGWCKQQVKSQKSKVKSFRIQKNYPVLSSPHSRLTLAACSLFFLTCLMALTASPTALANNLSVSNVTIASRSASADTATVQFDISWSNSWRNQSNWDAAWVFMKFSTDAGVTWAHATLKTAGTDPSGFSNGSGTSVTTVVPSDKLGGFVYRSAVGSGSLSTTGVRFVWDYAADGVADTASAIVRMFGVEMVYIPTESFYLGDGNATTEAAFALHVADNTAFQVTTASVASVTVDANANDDIDTSSISVDGDGGITGNASYPTGYIAFYVMKYEVTEGQWIGFFNTLTDTQKATRDITAASGKNADTVVTRNTIAWSSGDATTTNTDRACSFLSWMDGAAFADWSALRPFTELEYEKILRGPLTANVGEYAWGNAATITSLASISGSEDGTEVSGTSGANANYNSGIAGPVRAGIFATSSTTRTTAGAGYYGTMEFSGNLFERVVSVGNSTGRGFTGTNGNGALSANGHATNSDWPGHSAGEVSGATGSGTRGGGYSSAAAILKISDRTTSATTDTTRTATFGFRAARTAP